MAFIPNTGTSETRGDGHNSGTVTVSAGIGTLADGATVISDGYYPLYLDGFDVTIEWRADGLPSHPEWPMWMMRAGLDSTGGISSGVEVGTLDGDLYLHLTSYTSGEGVHLGTLPSAGWHTYRLVHTNAAVTLSVDGATTISVAATRYPFLYVDYLGLRGAPTDVDYLRLWGEELWEE